MIIILLNDELLQSSEGIYHICTMPAKLLSSLGNALPDSCFQSIAFFLLKSEPVTPVALIIRRIVVCCQPFYLQNPKTA
jgi:hypothetical protein